MTLRTATIVGVITLIVFTASGYGVYLYLQPNTVGTQTNNDAFGKLFPTSGERKVGLDEQRLARQKAGENTPTTVSEPPPQTTRQSGNNSATGATRRHLSLVPIGGYSPFTVASSSANTAGRAPSVRYIERATGHLYQIAMDENIPTKISDTTLPKVQESYWNSASDTLVLRSFEGSYNTVKTLLASLTLATSSAGTATTGTLAGGVLPESVREIAISPDKKQIFYLNLSAEGVVGITTDFKNKKQKQVFSSPFAEWLPAWPTPDTITLTTKPSGTAPGTVYALNITTGVIRKLLPDTPGLTARMSRDGTQVAYSQSTPLGFVFYILSVKDGSADILPMQTLPEKCAWGTKNKAVIYCAVPKTILPETYPDSWYQGTLSFSDTIVRLDTTTGRSETLYDPTGTDGADLIDGVNLELDSQETVLYFVNKRDGTLWGIKIDN